MSNSKAYMEKWRVTHKIEIAEQKKNWWAKYPLRRVWVSMRQRCYNLNDKGYKYYGGRGISVCDAWADYKTFEKWALENGWQKGLTIDRINNNGNYEPNNCQFITQSENNKKRRMRHSPQPRGIDGRFYSQGKE